MRHERICLAVVVRRCRVRGWVSSGWRTVGDRFELDTAGDLVRILQRNAARALVANALAAQRPLATPFGIGRTQFAAIFDTKFLVSGRYSAVAPATRGSHCERYTVELDAVLPLSRP